MYLQSKLNRKFDQSMKSLKLKSLTHKPWHSLHWREEESSQIQTSAAWMLQRAFEEVHEFPGSAAQLVERFQNFGKVVDIVGVQPQDVGSLRVGKPVCKQQ